MTGIIRFRDLSPEYQRIAEQRQASALRAALPSEHENAILQIARTLAEENDYSEREIAMLQRYADRTRSTSSPLQPAGTTAA
jgi:hypothetical protein